MLHHNHHIYAALAFYEQYQCAVAPDSSVLTAYYKLDIWLLGPSFPHEHFWHGLSSCEDKRMLYHTDHMESLWFVDEPLCDVC